MGMPAMHPWLPMCHACTADSVNGEVYCALRRLFIERLDLDRRFDFHG